MFRRIAVFLAFLLFSAALHASPPKEALLIANGKYSHFAGLAHPEADAAKLSAALDRFLLRKQGRNWDGVPVPNVSQADLDPVSLSAFRKRALRSKRLTPEILQEADEGLLEKLHLMDGTYLKRAAILLFHPDPERFVTGAYIKIGFFRTNADLVFHDEIHGDLFSQVDKTLETLRAKYLKALISYDGVQRVETYPVPEEALREAILNAIAHKDYSSGTPIQISVYADKLWVWNPGHLPLDWTVARLTEKHSSKPFNPDIANAFFRAGEIESWGRGIERILTTCQAAHCPAPIIDYTPGDFWLKFAFAPEHLAKTITEPSSGKSSGKSSVKTPVKTPGKILQLLKEKPQPQVASSQETPAVNSKPPVVLRSPPNKTSKNCPKAPSASSSAPPNDFKMPWPVI